MPSNSRSPDRLALCLFAIVALSPGRSNALDAGSPAGLITETVAGRENLKDYDGATTFGAQSVGDRGRKHVSPEGLRAGNFYFFPSAETKVGFDDNIFGASKNETSDIRTELTPSLIIKSHLPRHVLNMAFSGSLVSFAENSDQDYLNASAALDSALHLNSAHTLALSAATSMYHEERSELTASNQAAEPSRIHKSHVSLGLTRDIGRLYGTLSATAQRVDYSDVAAVSGGTINQDNRDRDTLSTQLQAGYRFSPGFEAIGKLRLLRQLNGDQRFNDIDATGYEALVGLSMESNPLLKWRILGGYGLRDYDSNPRGTSGTSLIEGHVEWLPTQTLTIYGSVGREFNDSSGENFNGWIETSAEAGAEIEIYNNLVLRLGAGFAHADFEGINRTDNIYSGSIGLEYFMNKNWLFTFSYDHELRDSDDDAFDVTRNRFMVGAKLRF